MQLETFGSAVMIVEPGQVTCKDLVYKDVTTRETTRVSGHDEGMQTCIEAMIL